MPVLNLHHLVRAGGYSLEGLARAWKQEQAFRHEVLVLPLLVCMLWLTGKPFGLSILAIGGWLLVMAFELLNSAIETAFNMITLERDDRVKAGKDMASAAIFLAIAANVGLWMYIFC